MTDLVPPPSDRPAHYRLSTATWELILKEYREGATARELALKWRVSQHAVRKRITMHDSTKRDWGDSQAITQAVLREAELAKARANTPEAKAARLFATDPGEDAAAGDPGELARAAVLASGRAMRGQLWTEARTLAGLAEVYTRLAERRTAAADGDREGEPRLDAAEEDQLRADLLQRILAMNADMAAGERAAAAGDGGFAPGDAGGRDTED
ncbi:hypothetical protein [uncultured Brevundimonas sp.]|uniref:hypothetical protein n=1 Tax=uncultured Brevundimonas sp. TaxID=213418 RepID=UPI0030ED9456|tara:strand:+ start:7289 stop:7924 length:636 start_codon:yes stop_codon:yes gene_type:complete